MRPGDASGEELSGGAYDESRVLAAAEAMGFTVHEWHGWDRLEDAKGQTIEFGPMWWLARYLGVDHEDD